MSSINVEIDTDSGVLSANISLSPLEAWWHGLVSRNAKSRARDLEFGAPTVLDICPHCGADPLHFTVIYAHCTQRVCRKCETVLEDLVWLL